MSMETSQNSELNSKPDNKELSDRQLLNPEDDFSENKSFSEIIKGALNKVVSLWRGSKEEIKDVGALYEEVAGEGQGVEEIVEKSSEEIDSKTGEYMLEIEDVADPALVEAIMAPIKGEEGPKPNKEGGEPVERTGERLKNAAEIKELNNQIEKNEVERRKEIAAQVAEFFKKFDMSDDVARKEANISAMREIIIPSLKNIEEEKINKLSDKDRRRFEKQLVGFSKLMPKNKWAKDLTIASVVAIGSVAFSMTAFPGLPIYLGSKIVRSVIGSVVGEKVSDAVGKITEKHYNKKNEKEAENFQYNKEDVIATADLLVQLGENNLNDSKKREKLMKYAKIAIHIGTAGVVMSSLEPVFSAVINGNGLGHSIFKGLLKSMMFAGIELGAETAAHHDKEAHHLQAA